MSVEPSQLHGRIFSGIEAFPNLKQTYPFKHISVEEAHAKLEAMRAYFDERKRPNRALVYHYTSLASLRGILDSRAIFCTDYRFLNDKTEFRFGLDVAELMLRKNGIDAGLTEADVSDVLDQICVLSLGRDVAVYCASWSLDGNDLSQWRAYAPQDGVSIGFDAQALSNLASMQGFLCTPVAYFGASWFDEWFLEQLELLKRVLNAQISCDVQYSDVYDGPKDKNIDELLGFAVRRADICRWIGQVCATIKQPDFSCEQEWRVIFIDVLNGFKKSPEIKTRQSSYRALPYIEFGLVASGMTIDRLIKEVHLGPANTLRENIYIAEVLMKSVGAAIRFLLTIILLNHVDRFMLCDCYPGSRAYEPSFRTFWRKWLNGS